MAQLKHPRHQRSLTALSVKHGEEALLLPDMLAKGIVKQAGRCCGRSAIAIVDRHFGRATCRPFATAQVELTGGIVAGMAGHALFSKDRLNVPAVGNSGGNGRTLRRGVNLEAA